MKRTLLKLLIPALVVVLLGVGGFFIYKNYLDTPENSYSVIDDYLADEQTEKLLNIMQTAQTKYVEVSELSAENRIQIAHNLLVKMDYITSNLNDQLLLSQINKDQSKSLNTKFNQLQTARKDLISDFKLFNASMINPSPTSDFSNLYDENFEISVKFLENYATATQALLKVIGQNLYKSNPNLNLTGYDILINLTKGANDLAANFAFKPNFLDSFQSLSAIIQYEDNMIVLPESMKPQGIYDIKVVNFITSYNNCDGFAFANNFAANLLQKVSSVTEQTTDMQKAVYYFSLIFEV